ncbi:MAG TPA: DEAD/DEAH box helicase [Spirochaetota bacterium]|nr:DEAD/DEAH box helicase [Spirochaetota bacterium]HPP04067.1 DEAD/DEAH box helicase [Spirochaetota bacterium]
MNAYEKELNYIKHLFGPEVFKRGMEYYKKAHVSNIVDMGNKITSTVDGSVAGKVYNVTIEKTSDGKITNSICSCPYNSFCKHGAATMIYYIKHGPHKVIEKEIVNPLTVVKEDINKEIVFEIGEKSKDSNFNNIFNFLTYPKKEKLEGKNIKERWKLIFLIKKDYMSYYEHKDRLILTPGLIYIKKDGSFGRVIDFKEEKLTEPIEDELEIKLFNNLFLKNYYKDDLETYFEFLLQNKDRINLYSEGYNYFSYTKVQFLEIDKVIVDFKLKGIDFNTNTPDFKVNITLLTKNNESILLENRDNSISISLDYIIILDNNGRLFYKKTNFNFIEFLRRILKHSTFYKEDIDFLKKIVEEKLKDEVILNFNKKKIKILNILPKPILELSNHFGEKEYSFIDIFFNYRGKEIRYHYDFKIFQLEENIKEDEIVLVKRDISFEQEVKKYLKYKFKKAHIDDYGSFILEQDFVLNIPLKEFLINFGLPLMDEGYELRFKNQKIKISKSGGFKLKLNITTGIDWFDVSTSFVDEEGNEKKFRIDHNVIKTGIVIVEDKFYIMSKDDIKTIQRLTEEGLDENGNLRIPKIDFTAVEVLYSAVTEKERDKNLELKFFNELAKKIKDFKKIDKNPLPKEFKGKLREYQEGGYNWLHFLHKYNLNGCLADDMGLGKTVQTLAFLQSLKEKGELGLSMLVVPVTTVANWENEIRRFTPELRFVRHLGTDRVKDDKDFFKDFDIIISSYHTLRNDIEFFKDIEFDYLILDEAQNIKNSRSLLFKTVKIINSKHRLSLTGTPIENNTFELWSQFNFLNPSLLGNLNDFKHKFVYPIEVHKDKNAVEKLRKTIYPFILRRKKEEVAKDLPEKEEIIVYCEMNKEQREFYNELRDYYRDHIGETIVKNGVMSSVIQILEALLRLRQACLFPSLVTDKYKDLESTKFETLKDVIEEILMEDHKILLFSQFVQSLKIIEDYVKKKNIQYSYIDGQTKKRDVEIKKFQEDKNVKLFLISLKAGGVGINLTAADYVILFDPWWNPAVENQAVDRSHRIGQTKKVIVYRLIVKDTVEERILELQQRKKELVSELVTEDASFFKSLSKDDIMKLFS